jgi:hypothetical protein
MLMSAGNRNYRAYSADVRMELSVNGAVFSIGQLGPDYLILDDPTDHPPAEGEITVSIDGRVKRWRVQLPDGIAAGTLETRIADCPSGANGAAGR